MNIYELCLFLNGDMFHFSLGLLVSRICYGLLFHTGDIITVSYALILFYGQDFLIEYISQSWTCHAIDKQKVVSYISVKSDRG